MTLRRTGDWGRTSGLTRYSELRSTTPLPRTGELSRTAPLRRVSRVRTQEEVRASRPTVSAEERLARAVVRLRATGLCEGCGRAPATDYAHRVRRGPGKWCPSNALHLCGGLAASLARPGALSCHGWSHANPTAARSIGWLLRTTDDPETTPVLLPRGWVRLHPDGSITPVQQGDAA